MSSPQTQLLKHERDYLRELDVEGAVASGTVEPLIARLWDWEGYHRSQGMTDEQVAQRVADRSLLHPDWTREQVLTALSIETLGHAVNQDLGIARRIVHDAPAELALGVALGTRLAWLQRRLQEQIGMGMEDGEAYLAQLALPVRDEALIRRVLDAPLLEEDPVRALIYQGIAAAFRRDLDALRPIGERLGKRKVDRMLRGTATSLVGIAGSEPATVVEGLQDTLESENWLRKRKEGRIICLEAHQFYRLAEWVSPELVSGFDVAQGLPWDAGFHAWTEQHRNPLEGPDLNGISPILHDALIDLKLPPWFRVIEEPELPRDVCRLILTDVGPNPGPVRKMVEQWRQMLRWGPADLDQCPVVLTSKVPRVNACMMRKSLLELGASARFEKVSRPV